MVLHTRRAASERPRRRNFTASLALVTSQPSRSLISTQWFALRAHSSAVSNSSSAMSVNLATKRSAEETSLAAEEHYKSNRSTPSGFCYFRAGSADTYPQHSTYHSILHLHS